MTRRSIRLSLLTLSAMLLVGVTSTVDAKKKKSADATPDDPYAEYVWPPPPDEARIKLDAVITGRADVEATSKLRKALIGAGPQSQYDRLVKPFAVEFDAAGRILVTDSATNGLIRFDRDGERMDVLGTQGNLRLKVPLGLHVGSDGLIYVASSGTSQVLAFRDDGGLAAVYGEPGELENPTDACLSPDGTRLYVADSKAHRIVVFSIDSGDIVDTFGSRGEAEGRFAYPTSIAFGPEGNLFVVDQLNARVQLVDPRGEYIDSFGGRGTGTGDFVRPKDIAVDRHGLLYVTDNAFNNVQIFDIDFTLLTFVGSAGRAPGRFLGVSGVAVHGDEIAVVDQLGARVQVFRFLQSRGD